MDMNSSGDTWDACWADDDRIYLTSDDTGGFRGQPGSNLQFHVLEGKTVDGLLGRTINRMQEYGPPSSKGPDGNMWKADGITAVDGNLYIFVSRHGLNFSTRQTAQNSSLIVSTDKGRTWRRSAKENYDKPMFPGTRFGSPFFVKYGKDGAGHVHNADKYVYAVANNGFWENGDDMILGRVLKTQIARLQASDWQFFMSGDGLIDGNWSPRIEDAKPMLSNPGKCSMTGVQYIEALQRYIMIQWYYTNGSGHVASTATSWIFYESPTPWGPWEPFGTQHFSPEGYYDPCVLPKFISEDGLDFMILTAGDFNTHALPGALCLYRLTYIPCSLHKSV
jgi:hypothetical protein